AVTKVGIWRACTASAGLKSFSVPSSRFSEKPRIEHFGSPLRTENGELVSGVLPVGTVPLGDGAYCLIPRDYPGDDQGKYQARSQRFRRSFSNVDPVQPEGKIDFQGEHAQQGYGRIEEGENRKNLDEA